MTYFDYSFQNNFVAGLFWLDFHEKHAPANDNRGGVHYWEKWL